MPDRQLLAEATASLGTIRQTQPGTGRFRALLIREGWGSSGYYSEALLRRDGAKTWPAGTQMYLDHPSVSESAERPERSVRDLASVTLTDAQWDPALRGLVAEVQVFPQWRDLLNEEFARAIGLSIRAAGTVEYGEAEGRQGPLVASLDDGVSVDWVTKAGAGGRVLELIESARGSLAEGRHSAGWDEDKHPRASDGRFGSKAGVHSGGGDSGGGRSHGGSSRGGSGGRHAAGSGSSGGGDPSSGRSAGSGARRSDSSDGDRAKDSRSYSAKTSRGSAEVTNHRDGSATVRIGDSSIDVDQDEYKDLAGGLAALAMVKAGVTSSGRSFTVGKDRPIPTDAGDEPLAIVKRTDSDTFQVHLRPRKGATRDEILASPGTEISGNDGDRISSAMRQYELERAQEEKAAKAAERAENVRANRTDPEAARRRATSRQPTPTDSDERGMPNTIARREVTATGGRKITVHREEGDDYTHLSSDDGRSFALTGDEITEIDDRIGTADDDRLERGEHDPLIDEDGFTFGRITKTGSRSYDVEIDGQPAFTLSTRDAEKIREAHESLVGTRRFNTSTGKIDLFPAGGGKLGLRHLGDDGRPVETVFNAQSKERLDHAVDVIFEGFDEEDTSPDAPDAGVTSTEFQSNVGPVRVEITDGEWGEPGAKLWITPVTGDAWGAVIDAPNMDDFTSALSDLMEARTAGRPAGRTLLNERAMSETISTKPWSGFSAADYSIEQWRKACLIGPAEASDSKGDYSLPVREPDGTLNRNAVHAAAARIGQVKADTGAKSSAAKTLAALYRQLDEDPPESLAALAEPQTKPAKEAASDRHAELVEGGGSIGAYLESRIHAVFTQLTDDMYGEGHLTRDERIALSSAIGDGLKAFVARVEADQPGLYRRGLYDTLQDAPAMVSETSGATLPAPAEAAPAAASQPVDAPPAAVEESTPPGTPPVPTEQIKESEMPELTEELQRQLAEAATLGSKLEEAMALLGTATTQLQALTERADAADARADAADAKALRLENDKAARTAVAEALQNSTLPARCHARVTESVCRALPTLESGELDTAALSESITAAIDAENSYAAGLLEDSGAGQVRGLGESKPLATEPLSESDFETGLAEQFARLGLTSDAAKAAAAGRR
ncbi:hypothetical protein Ssi03_50600 [Sphaerisporangium siamense]|uniref:Uncharacterized protein n=1 Tax=Sphaerisporangium siamense TaxID=795645 RepID=A0A7W7GCR1_9ACTN|nr:hypothetical protein [Sphaerisporangium siamense]MBB4702236.1 hypothetical protein [Sphaerisporangium siamense]GII87070.1 hypothetical protein Ssi03_50600 [Sphaerisporangium siamense]